MSTKLKIVVKEVRGSYCEKIDDFTGTANQCAKHIIMKYGNNIFDMPAHEFFNLTLQDLLDNER